MTALAERTGAINLGQGFPDVDGPREAVEAVVAALRSGHANQYAPLPGVPALRDAIFAHQRACYGLEPEDLIVTFGATEAIASAVLGLCDPGDEVVVLEPLYDSTRRRSRSRGRSGDGAVAPARVRLTEEALHEAITGGAGVRGCCCSTRPTTRPGGCSTRPSWGWWRGRAPSTTSCASRTRSTSTSCSTANMCRRRRCRGWASGR